MRARPLLATALALAALTGCSGDAEPVAAVVPAPVTPAPTTESAPVEVPVVEDPAPTPTPTGPGMEWVYEQNGRFEENEAATFAAYWLATLNYGRRYNDSSPLREISAPECDFCAASIEAMDLARQYGDTYEGGEVYLRHSYVTYVDAVAQEMDVELEMTAAAGRVLAADGSVLKELSAFEHDYGGLQLRMRDGRWSIVGAG